jgi:hypothetical protein
MVCKVCGYDYCICDIRREDSLTDGCFSNYTQVSVQGSIKWDVNQINIKLDKIIELLEDLCLKKKIKKQK